MMFANTVDFQLSLDFFDSGLYTRTAVAHLTLALAKLSCRYCYKIAARQLCSLSQPLCFAVVVLIFLCFFAT